MESKAEYKINNAVLQKHMAEYKKTGVVSDEFGRIIMQLSEIIVRRFTKTNDEFLISDVTFRIFESLPKINPEGKVFNYMYVTGVNYIKTQYGKSKAYNEFLEEYERYVKQGFDCGKKVGKKFSEKE